MTKRELTDLVEAEFAKGGMRGSTATAAIVTALAALPTAPDADPGEVIAQVAVATFKAAVQWECRRRRALADDAAEVA